MAYVHGFSTVEQDRLLTQAKFLEPLVFSQVDFSTNRHVLEIGCGVGAQTRLLLSRFSNLKTTSVDFSEAQLEVAAKTLEKPIKEGRVVLKQASVYELPFQDETFDGLFICWFLEHLMSPGAALKELNRVLKPGAKVFFSEVFNLPLAFYPHSPVLEEYWIRFCEYQRKVSGDPWVGIRARSLFKSAGFQSITLEVHSILLDGIQTADSIAELAGSHLSGLSGPELRRVFLEYWLENLLSGLRQMVQGGISFSFAHTLEQTEQVIREEISKLVKNPDSILHFSYTTGAAVKPNERGL
jgi:ubiquinone/menaquinone biosynthesis C-methylase UbiE